MNHLGAWLAGGLTLIVIVAIGVFSFLPKGSTSSTTPPEATLVEPVNNEIIAAPTLDQAQLEANLTQREAIYQGQATQLDQTIQQRQQTYQDQIQLLTGQVTSAQEQLAALQAQEQALTDQVAQLEAARAERLNQYQTQLSQAQAQYSSRFNELQTQLTQIQTKLAEANAQLEKKTKIQYPGFGRSPTAPRRVSYKEICDETKFCPHICRRVNRHRGHGHCHRDAFYAGHPHRSGSDPARSRHAEFAGRTG